MVVTDGFWPKTLVAVRSLGEAGERVLCGEQSRLAPALVSRHCARAFRYPDPGRDERRFAARLLEVADGEADPVLLPMEEETLMAVLRQRALLETRYRIPFASLGLLENLRDKAWAMEHAPRHGIAVPATERVDSKEAGRAAAQRLGYPLMVKLRISSGGRGVTRVEDAAQLEVALGRALRTQPRPLLQRCLSPAGEALGVSLLMDAGRGGGEGRDGFPETLVAALVHRRLRQYPPRGGSSTLREAVRDPELTRRCAAFLARIGFHGVAMLEFKRDAVSGELLLLEINPRFWGSLHQAVLAGVNFPRLLVQIARGERPERVLDYRTDRRSRAFFPGDLMHYLRARPRPRAREFFRWNDPAEHDEAFRRDDLWPGGCKLIAPLALLWSPGIRRLAARPKPAPLMLPPRLESPCETS